MARTVLVTGAAGGVGLELVKLLAAAGDEVVGVVLDEAEAARVRAAVPTVRALVPIDLADADSVAPALAPIFAAPGFKLDAVVTCAAVWPGGPLETTPLSEFRETFEINTMGCVAIYQQCLPLLRATKGRFVFVSSISGKVALPFNGAYTLSKYAIEALGDLARREAGKWGVKVSIVEPGPIKTPMVTAMAAKLDRERAALTDEARALYGDLYDAFALMVEEGYPTATEPKVVAETIVEALDAAEPLTRYEVDDTARFLCGMPRTMTDLQIDEIAIASVTAKPKEPA
ncbi:MAG: SDR family NAD(P)-dependent oxidoreductase [Caulobacteraceae bacterium]